MAHLVADTAIEMGADLDALMQEVREFMAEDSAPVVAEDRDEDYVDEDEEEPAPEDIRDGDGWTTAQLAALTRYVFWSVLHTSPLLRQPRLEFSPVERHSAAAGQAHTSRS